ncbi:MAG: OmpA family protein [Mariprofundaceae bacterium]|nr:OmpA family protein [Mariprofundaceae bacterium]
MMKSSALAIIIMFLLSGCYALNKEHYNSVVETPEKIESLEKSNEKMQQDIRSLKDSLSRMQNNMHSEISNESVAIAQPTATSIQVVLQQQLMFDSGSSDISGTGREVLVKVADALHHAPESATIRIVGHSDNRPVGAALKTAFTDNWGLSAARAAAVARFLVWGAQINPNRLHIEASAGTQPIADNASEEGRAQNRRIELFVEES